MGDPRNLDTPPTAAHNLVATYSTPEQARYAIETLERKGIEAGNISILGEGVQPTAGPETNLEQRRTDMATTGKVGKRALSGVVVGALIGAVLGGLGGWLVHEVWNLGPNAFTVALGGAVGLAAISAYAGFWYGGASALPVSEAWGDTFESVRGGQSCVAVHSEDPSQVDRAADALSGSDAVRIVRFGRDGKKTQLA